MSATINPDLLRGMVRELIRGAVPQLSKGQAVAEVVQVTNEVEVRMAFGRILRADADERANVESGLVQFRLAGSSSVTTPNAVAHRVDRGAVTERHVQVAAQAGAVILTSHRVVITAVAREQASKLGVTIRKET